jgi:glycosyltransferase involved in cell wall biosynthesis
MKDRLKIVLSNYRYHITGGPERYLFAIKALLEQKGHFIFPFSVHSNLNEPTEFSKYFISPIDIKGNDYYKDYNKNISTYLKLLSRQFYSIEAYKKSRKLAIDLNPDIVFSLHFLNKMSPSALDGFKSKNIPIVVRVSDFNIICPQGHLLLNGRICEECLTGNLLNCFWNRCIEESYIGSLIKTISWTFHRMIKFYERIDAFICPSVFTCQKMIEAGVSPKKLFHVPTPTKLDNLDLNFTSGKYILYFGRIAEEKGVGLLIAAYSQLPPPKPDLFIISNFSGRKQWIRDVRKNYKQINLISFQPLKELRQYISRALFVVVPSLWYENMPNTVLEAFAHGKPVLASRIGSLQELVVDGSTGLLFEPGNIEDLKQKLVTMYSGEIDLGKMGRNARHYVEKHHSEDEHYRKLMSIFKSLLS